MKPFNLFPLMVLPFVYFSFAWQLQELIPKVFTAPSRIPQFIIDTGHPWLEENRHYLEQLDSTKQALCSLDSNLRPGIGQGAPKYPTDLFKYLEIDNNRAGIDRRSGWNNAVLRLREMLDCPAAIHDVENLNIQIWVTEGKQNLWMLGSSDPPNELPDLFIDTLKSMPRLQKLEWNTFGNANQVFQKAFVEANLTLPSVRHLVPAMFTDYLVGMCPSATHIESGHSLSTSDYWRWEKDGDARLQLIESTTTARNITNFCMRGEWELKHLEALLQASPNITTLTMGGEIAPRYSSSYGSLDESRGQLLKDYVEVLSRFPRLENLCLPPSWGLGLGFDGGAWCGNAYFGTEGRQYGREVSRRGAETMELAANIVLIELPNLQSLCIGNTYANVTRDDHGDLAVAWPWTGRMTEWTYEIWPESENFM